MGCSKRREVGACSMILPWYMTSTRSQSGSTTPRLADEQARKVKAFPQLLQERQYLRLHGYVQRRDWLVGDNHRWACYKCSRYRDTLTLAS